MRRVVALLAATVTVVGLGSCTRAERPPVEACATEPAATREQASVDATDPFLGMTSLPDTSVALARLDPLSLEPVSQQLEVGEYHDAWSLSPDRSQVALGVSSGGSYVSPSRRVRARIGIVVVDIQTMKVVAEVETGVAAEAVAWLAPRLLVAGLLEPLVDGRPHGGGTVLVDPVSGEILRRWPDLSDPQASATTQDAFVMLFPGPAPAAPNGTAAPHLAVVDRNGRLQSVALDRIRLALRDGVQWDEAGLAVDAARARAFVFAADAPVADVDLRTLRVRYRRLEPLFLRPGELAGSDVRRDDEPTWRSRRALWLGDGRALVSGRDDFATPGGEDSASIPAGAFVVDTDAWTSCVLDPSAGGAAHVAGNALVYGRGDPASRGVRAYTAEGREAFRLFGGEEVRAVHGVADRAYVRTQRATYVVDARGGKVLREIVPPRELVDVVDRP